MFGLLLCPFWIILLPNLRLKKLCYGGDFNTTLLAFCGADFSVLVLTF